MNCVSDHQLPLAREMVRLVGEDNFAYIDAGLGGQAFQTKSADESWVSSDEAQARTADVLLTGLRKLDLFECRATGSLKTFYFSERWFKPIFGLPGWIRMLVPSYRRMARRFVRWVNADPCARVFAAGPWAEKDFRRMGVCGDKIVPWGYFVSPSEDMSLCRARGQTLKVLWVGRMLDWKCVDTIIRAVGRLIENQVDVFLTLVGDGPERCKLKALVENNGLANVVMIMPCQTGKTIRRLMHENDLYVLASNACEGWGAALSEALEEGMSALGTYEAGASAALLPSERLYHAGDVDGLVSLMLRECRMELPTCSIGAWTAKNAALRLLSLANGSASCN